VTAPDFLLRPVGVVRSDLRDRELAPMQGDEGAPDVWIELRPEAVRAAASLAPGDELLVLTWFHQADRSVLEVHPRSDPSRPLTGVFSTRSPDRPNPIGLHRVTVTHIASPTSLQVDALEAIDGTPILDLKVAMKEAPDA